RCRILRIGSPLSRAEIIGLHRGERVDAVGDSLQPVIEPRELQVVEAGKQVALRIVDRAGAVIGGETVPGRGMIPGADHELLPSGRELEPAEQYRLAALEEVVGAADDEGRDRDPILFRGLKLSTAQSEEHTSELQSR